MGREAKILLALLGLLGGVFCGVLSMKLFVHRPPTGVGPDVLRVSVTGDDRGNPATRTSAIALPTSAFAAAPPLASAGVRILADGDVMGPADQPDAEYVAAVAAGRFAAEPAVNVTGPASRDAEVVVPPEPRSTSGFAKQVAYEEPLAPASEPVADRGMQGTVLAAAGTTSGPRGGDVLPGAAAGVYAVRVGDSWWSVAERVYGDGRFYRALFAWNKAVDPRVSLVPGTRLEVPPLERLAAAWPGLCSPATR